MRAIVALLLPAALLSLPFGAAPAAATAVGAQSVGIPLYVDPAGTESIFWSQAQMGAPVVGVVIANPADGPGSKKSASYLAAIARMRAAGVRVLGYVYTGYGTRSQSTVKSEVDHWYTWYAPDGIFFDEGATSSGRLAYYQALHDYVAKKPGAHLVALNPGTNTLEVYTKTADLLMIFEDSAAAYAAWTPAPWTVKYPASRFWQLVYATPAANLASVMTLSRSRRAGMIYVTQDNLPNPWDSLPASDYWSAELSAAAAP